MPRTCPSCDRSSSSSCPPYFKNSEAKALFLHRFPKTPKRRLRMKRNSSTNMKMSQTRSWIVLYCNVLGGSKTFPWRGWILHLSTSRKLKCVFFLFIVCRRGKKDGREDKEAEKEDHYLGIALPSRYLTKTCSITLPTKVHGTRMLYRGIIPYYDRGFPVRSLPFFVPHRTWCPYATQGLQHISDIVKVVADYHNNCQIAKSMSTCDAEAFPYESFYFFGWSGKLSVGVNFLSCCSTLTLPPTTGKG